MTGHKTHGLVPSRGVAAYKCQRHRLGQRRLSLNRIVVVKDAQVRRVPIQDNLVSLALLTRAVVLTKALEFALYCQGHVLSGNGCEHRYTSVRGL